MRRTLFLNPKLEGITPKKTFERGIRKKAAKLWNRLTSILLLNQEPRIWQTKSNGQVVWHGYDPITGSSVTRHSEEEMRVWIEERYYQ